ncbi:MAG: HK97 gp10 family phage protein [Bacteroidales bacterium]|nr:HK97 gp10 family phage protein [Bacteroidales bacterium]
MGKTGSFDIRGLEEFQKELEKMQDDRDEFVESCCKELAARLLSLVIPRTPVGQYPAESGKKGGTLRRGWTGQKNQDAKAWANSLPVVKEGSTYTITVTNPTEYASYVEFGHRTRNHAGWVPGQFMLTMSESDLRSITPQILQAKLDSYFGGK